MLLGGFGFLSRLYGLSIDNLVEVEMVLADGRIVIVNNDEYPGMFTSFYHRRSPSQFCAAWNRFMVGPTRSWICIRRSDTL